jgi:hypothetical protein
MNYNEERKALFSAIHEISQIILRDFINHAMSTFGGFLRMIPSR